VEGGFWWSVIEDFGEILDLKMDKKISLPG